MHIFRFVAESKRASLFFINGKFLCRVFNHIHGQNNDIHINSFDMSRSIGSISYSFLSGSIGFIQTDLLTNSVKYEFKRCFTNKAQAKVLII